MTSDPKGGHLNLVPEVRLTADPSASSPGELNLGGIAGTATTVRRCVQYIFKIGPPHQ